MNERIETLLSAPCEPRPPANGAESVSLAVQAINFVVITLPLLGVVVASVSVSGAGFHWTDLGLLIGMYFATAVGITVGFHRLFVHRSFETPLALKFVFAVLGSMAVQGSLRKWVAMHRRHHQTSDTPDDPHSPHHHGSGVRGVLQGLWHSHMGWFFIAPPPHLDRYLHDINGSAALRVASLLFPVWVGLGLAIPAILGGLLTHSWTGMWTGLIWGGLVRIFLVHHITWSINSACHLWGSRPFRSEDQSRNNFVFGVLALGEGWHNTHHAFPSSVRHGLRWWEIDASYWFVRVLALLGLAWNLKLPTRDAQLRKQSVVCAK